MAVSDSVTEQISFEPGGLSEPMLLCKCLHHPVLLACVAAVVLETRCSFDMCSALPLHDRSTERLLRAPHQNMVYDLVSASIRIGMA